MNTMSDTVHKRRTGELWGAFGLLCWLILALALSLSLARLAIELLLVLTDGS